jgi:hypothetical protein
MNTRSSGIGMNKRQDGCAGANAALCHDESRLQPKISPRVDELQLLPQPLPYMAISTNNRPTRPSFQRRLKYGRRRRLLCVY